MEDDQKNSKWKTTKKIQNGRQPKKFKMINNDIQQPNSIQFKNQIVQIGCGSAPGNLVFYIIL